MRPFAELKETLMKQYERAVPDESTGVSLETLKAEFDATCAEHRDEPHILLKARLMSLIYRKARFAVERENPFLVKLEGKNELVLKLRGRWWHEEMPKRFTPEDGQFAEAWGIGYMVDCSHVAPDWPAVLELGLPGLRERAATGGTAFHRAVTIVYDAAIEFCRRCGAACGNDAMLAIAEHAPQTLKEAFVLTYVFHELAEHEGEEVRSMGWFDRSFITFYRNDLAAGRLTRESAKELIKYYWTAFYAKYQGLRFGKNFCFGPDINELSYLGMEVYHEMNMVDPKLSVRVTDKTPQDFLELCCRNIRDGRTGIVMLNDRVVIDGLIRHGRKPEDARDFIPIGCYEPAVMGKEVAISGATHIFMAAAFQSFFEKGRQYATFRELLDDFIADLRHAADVMVRNQRKCEDAWADVNPAPFISGTFSHCIAVGKDYTEGGCDYNSTGCVISFIAEVTDALAAIQYLVYDEKVCTLDELRAACAADWKGHEELQLRAKHRAPKYGNNNEKADDIAVEIASFIGPYLNRQENGRGGHMFAALFGQHVVDNGRDVHALPNGRNAGESVSKNMDACIGMDKDGVTSLMNTVLKIDMRDYPNGTCLDLMLHPSAVSGEDGIRILTDVIRAFIARGGSGLQFNIFDVNALRDAQKHPENYSTLQVRVCGWNARFIDLTHDEQNTFIAQAAKLV